MSQAAHEHSTYYNSRMVIDLTVDVPSTIRNSVQARSLTNYHSVIDLTSEIDPSEEREGATFISAGSSNSTMTESNSNSDCPSVLSKHELANGKCKLKVHGRFSFCCCRALIL
jgi:hypothetical protein